MYDVIIVGAGPGGAFTAKLLAEAGLDVILIEKDRIPRDKPCAGWITPKVIELTSLSTSKLSCFQQIKGGVVWEPNGKKLIPYVVKYRKPISYGIRRIEFDTLLVGDAKDAGAEVVDSSYVTKIHRQKEMVIVQAKNNQEFKGHFVVGADGTHSIVAKELKLRHRWEPTELLQGLVAETDIGEAGPSLTDYYGYPEIFIAFKTMSYSWYFTKSPFLNIGLGIQMSKISSTTNARILYEQFLRKLNRINHLKGIKLAPLKAHTYPVYYGPYHYPTYGSRVLLVGDAGGFPINFTGEGIRTALQTGKFAAETLIETLEKGNTDLSEYFNRWNLALREEYILGDLIQMIGASQHANIILDIFLEEKRLRKLFLDLFFNVKNPRQIVRQLLLYLPFLNTAFLKWGFKSFLEELGMFTA